MTENDIYTEAIEQIEKNHDLTKENVIVLSSDTWHHGVIGIVASRLTERFNLPSILISFESMGEGENIGKGSARSVKGLNLVKALSSCEDLLCKYGGHELAAGLTIERDKLPEFTERLDKYVKENIDRSAANTKTVIEAEIHPRQVTEETIESVSLLEPFGSGNPIPLFVVRNCLLTSVVPLSLGKHTKFSAVCDGETLSAVCFGNNLAKEGFSIGDEVDIVCSLDINEFRGVRTVQLIVKDIDYSETYKEKLSLMQREADGIIGGRSVPLDADVPDRTQCSQVYSELKNLLVSGRGMISVKKLIASPGAPSYIQAATALTAFCQTGLLKLEKISEFDYRAEMIKTDGKVDLTAAPVMLRKTGENQCSAE